MKFKFLMLFWTGIITLASFVSAHVGENESLHHGGFSMMGGMFGGVYGYGMMFFGWLFGLLVLVALVLLIIWLIKEIQKK